MRILFIENWMHTKNLNALLKYNIKIVSIKHTNLDKINLNHFDLIYSPACTIDVSKYPNSKFIFGPHFSVFPNKNQLDLITGNKNVIYIQPSEWAKNVWSSNPICKNIRFETLPFGVDTDKFNEIKPISKRDKVFVYFKRRQQDELNFITDFLKTFGITVRIFDYVNRYDEAEYIDYLHNSKFGIWLDAHESQGFALEEALSCNVPLLVWDVVSMNQEYGSSYPNISATTIPYWNNCCGESFTNLNDFSTIFDKFINNLSNYKPRKYILENLSIEICNKKFIEVVNKI
jgi:glycosyltransferase involved in cell wall biosynthesis